MIDSTNEYKAAIVGNPRRIKVMTVVNISDPDTVYGNVDMDSTAPWSKPEELYDKNLDSPSRYAVLEPNHWLLDGTAGILSYGYQAQNHVGVANNRFSSNDGNFETPAYIQIQFSGVSILQAISLFFSSNVEDGVPSNFTVDILVDDVVYFTKSFTDNRESKVSIEGFTVNIPNAIRLTITKWSLPYRRARVSEILLGIYEEWQGGMLYSFNCNMQADFSCLSLPYGTLDIAMDNKLRRFEPRNKAGIFQSIEERQGIESYIGVVLANGAIEYKKQGVFYQAENGWKTSTNNVTMDWNLVDIIGLVADRTYLPPEALPTTLDGWIASIVAQLGTNFESRYHVDPNYAGISVTANNRSDVTGKTCGDILRWACMATGTWPRARAEDGHLTVEPFWNQGNKLTLSNLENYPTMSANDSIAVIIFTLADGNNTQYIVSGTSTSSENTVSVSNPFIHTEEQARTAAKLILSCYGGNQIKTSGRGDPSSEIGDVDTVWLDESNATTGRRKTQSFVIQNGVLRGCESTLLQADGSFMFQNRVVITKPGTYKAEAGVTQLRVILVGKGSDGTAGTDGTWDEAGIDGVDGVGGLVWAETISINPEQEFSINIGNDTTLGPYSSANGQRYEYGQ